MKPRNSCKFCGQPIPRRLDFCSKDCVEAYKQGVQRVVHVVYKDHVMFAQSNSALLKPQLREAVGWLVYQCPEYVIVAWDRTAEPPTLKGTDVKACGVVLLRSEILELTQLC